MGTAWQWKSILKIVYLFDKTANLFDKILN